MPLAEKQQLRLLIPGFPRKNESGFPYQIVVDMCHRLPGMTGALHKGNLHPGMVHQDPEELTGGISCTANDSYLYFFHLFTV